MRRVMAPAAPRSRAHGLVLAAACAAPLALFALARGLEPDPRGWGTHEQLGFRPCYPMAQWNVPCPGCGVTTALAHAARGELLTALCVQPFGPIVGFAALALSLWALLQHARGRDLAEELPRLPWRPIVQTLATLGLCAWLYKVATVRGWA
jgi:hypothetical protein